MSFLNSKINKLCSKNAFNNRLDQGSSIFLGYAYFFSKPEPEYAYKRCAYKNIYPCSTLNP